MVTKEQIERFFKLKCSPQEADEVAQYFEENPDVLSQYYNEGEWEFFHVDNKPDADKAAAILAEIRKNTVQHQLSRKRFYVKYAVAAAVIGLIMFAGWYFFFNTKDNNIPQPAFVSRTIKNTHNEVMLFTLPDSSVVYLAPVSSIRFDEPFQNNQRLVALTGEASFDVKKDKAHPFVVKTDDIMTTVLGTRFSIRSLDTANTIKVTLFKGAVAVSNADQAHPYLKKIYYLSPGDILEYDKSRKAAILKTATHEKGKSSAPDNNEARRDNEKINTGGLLQDNNWYMFNNQSVAGVFDQLELLYNQKITYKKEDLEGLSFIGKIDKSDSLETILNLIGKLNNLEAIKESDGYLIKKK